MKTVLALKIAVFVTCLMGLSFLVIKYRGIKIEQEDIGIFEEAIALDCEANSLELTKDLVSTTSLRDKKSSSLNIPLLL